MLEVLEAIGRDAPVFHLALQGCVALQEGPIDTKKEAGLESKKAKGYIHRRRG